MFIVQGWDGLSMEKLIGFKNDYVIRNMVQKNLTIEIIHISGKKGSEVGKKWLQRTEIGT